MLIVNRVVSCCALLCFVSCSKSKEESQLKSEVGKTRIFKIDLEYSDSNFKKKSTLTKEYKVVGHTWYDFGWHRDYKALVYPKTFEIKLSSGTLFLDTETAGSHLDIGHANSRYGKFVTNSEQVYQFTPFLAGADEPPEHTFSFYKSSECKKKYGFKIDGAYSTN